jgi:hypothetical protein
LVRRSAAQPSDDCFGHWAHHRRGKWRSSDPAHRSRQESFDKHFQPKRKRPGNETNGRNEVTMCDFWAPPDVKTWFFLAERLDRR